MSLYAQGLIQISEITSPQQSNSKRFILFVGLAFICLMGLCIVYMISSSSTNSGRVTSIEPADLSKPVPVRISKETTWFTEPVQEEGTINYVEALNAQLSEGVTAENNVVVPLAQIVDPTPFDNNDEANLAFFQNLKVKWPEDDRELFLSIADYAHKKTEQQHTTFEKRLEEQSDDALVRPWSRDEFPELAEWLSYNQQFAETIHNAIQREKYYCPLVTGQSDELETGMLVAVLLPFQQNSRVIARFLVTNAMLSVQEGDIESAMQDLLACHRLGGHIGQGFCGVEGLIGISIEAYAFEAEIGLLNSGKMTDDQLREYKNELTENKIEYSMVDKVSFGDRLLLLDLIPRAYRQEKSMSALFVSDDDESFPVNTFMESHQGVDLNDIMSLVNQQYDFQDSQLKGKSYPQQIQLVNQFENKYEKIRTEYEFTAEIEQFVLADHGIFNVLKSPKKTTPFTARQLAQIYMCQFFLLNRPVAADCRNQTRRRLMQIALSLELHQRKQGRFPETLADIEPAIPPEQLVDPFSEEPLIYELTEEGYLLYSVGENMLDDGGVSIYDELLGDDIVIDRIMK